MKPIRTRLAGVTFDDVPNNMNEFGYKDIGTLALVREPNNQHDHNAVKVTLFGIYDMGYLPQDVARVVAPMMDAGTDMIAVIVKRNEPYEGQGQAGLTVRIVENY
jgi:hypothetical protein